MINDDSSTLVLEPDPGSSPSKMSKLSRFLLSFSGILFFGALLYFGGFESFDKIIRPDYGWLLVAIVGTGFMLFIFSIRWGVIVNSLVGRRLTSNVNYFFYHLSSLSLGAVIPHAAGTIIGKAAALKKFEEVPLKKSGASILMDKMFDGFFMLMFAWPLFFLLAKKATVLQVVLISAVEFVIVTLLVFANYHLWIRLLQAFISLTIKMMGFLPFLRRYGNLKNIEAAHNLKELEVLKRRTVLQSYFLTALGQVMLAARAWFAAMAIGLDVISPLDTFVGIGLVQAGVLFSFTPGALGIADAAWFVALAGAGIPKDIIAAFLVAARVIENLAIFLFWVPLYVYRVLKSHRSVV